MRLRCAASICNVILTVCLVCDSAAQTASLPAQLRGLRSTHRCAQLEAGQHPDHRVCFFTNLLLLNGALVYCGPDGASIPTVNTEYWLGKTLQENLITLEDVEQLQFQPQRVVAIEKAAFTDWTFYHNHFHVFAEYLPSLHNILCKYWKDCYYNQHSDLDILLLTKGIDAAKSKRVVHNEATKCITPKPISAISATEGNTHTAVLIKEAIAGWGPECRADHLHCLPWDLRRPPAAEMMQLWRQRVGECIGYDWDRAVTVTPPTIIVINRAANASRRIVNVDEVMSTLEQRYPAANVELHHLEGLTLKQQASIYSKASAVLWVHGASMANLIFLPRRAVGLHIVPRPHIPENLDWPAELVRDLSTEIKLIHIPNSHPDLYHLKTTQVTMDENYKGLYPAEQLAIWERGECIESMKRNMLPNDTSPVPLTLHHYCEEWWFKLALDITLNMTNVIPFVDDVINSYLPSLDSSQAESGEPRRRYGTVKIPQNSRLMDADPLLTRARHHQSQNGEAG